MCLTQRDFDLSEFLQRAWFQVCVGMPPYGPENSQHGLHSKSGRQ